MIQKTANPKNCEVVVGILEDSVFGMVLKDGQIAVIICQLESLEPCHVIVELTSNANRH